ncbi:uncharacterized protein [Physcomitrium patens]|uniref:uncharacterized protein n=1 Tax=Physcomitrium patens TaxID=3218 RepID=UPI003CCD1E84
MSSRRKEITVAHAAERDRIGVVIDGKEWQSDDEQCAIRFALRDHSPHLVAARSFLVIFKTTRRRSLVLPRLTSPSWLGKGGTVFIFMPRSYVRNLAARLLVPKWRVKRNRH